MTTLRPRLVVSDASKAIAFYVETLAATEISRFTHDGKVVHAELKIGPVSLTLKDSDGGDRDPHAIGGTPVFLGLDLDSRAAVDEIVERMVAHGAEIVFPIADHGDQGGYGGRLVDPFGHVWMFGA